MKKFNVYFSILLGLTILTPSCKKEGDHQHGDEVEIVLDAPSPGAMYNQGDTVFIRATVTAPEAMHGWEIHLRKKDDQTEIYSQDAHDHAATYTIDEYWVNNVSVDTEMELEVKAIIDHDGHTASKKVDIHCHQ